MINIVFEGITGSGKTTAIKEIAKRYSNKYKIGYIENINRKSIKYEKIKEKFYKDNFGTLRSANTITENELLKKIIDYLFIRNELYRENNYINLFEKNYFSIYSYAICLMNQDKKNNMLNNIFEYIKSGEQQIDLLVYFRKNIRKSIKRAENKNKKNFSLREKKQLKKINKELKEYIRYNNNMFSLLVIDESITLEKIIEKIEKKIDEIIIDKQKEDHSKWYELYKIDIEEFKTPDEYFKYKLSYKKKFINKVIKYSNNKRVIEAGCGTGLMAGYLQKKGLNVTALDLSKEVLDYAKKIALDSRIIEPCSIYQEGDILNLKYEKNTFGVSYSNGVLEHFSDQDIINTLKQQMNISDYVIFGIPSTYFNMDEKMLGNERSLTLKEWKSLINKAGGKIIEQTGFNYYNFFRRLVEIKKWFKPKAFWLFVIKKS